MLRTADKRYTVTAHMKMFVAIIFLCLTCSASFAGDPFLEFQKGQQAFSDKDYENAYVIWLKLANDNYALAQSTLAYLYGSGLGVEQNDSEAAKWMEMAADQGEPQSMYNLAGFYLEGKGVEVNYKKSEELYRGSLEKGFKVSVAGLITLYRNGVIEPKNDEEKKFWEKEEQCLQDQDYAQKLYSESRNASMP